MKRFLLIPMMMTLSFSQTLEVDLQGAINTALQNNKQQKISKIALSIADAQYNQALSANYPMIDMNVAGIRNKEDSIFEMKGAIDLPASTAKALAYATAESFATGAGAGIQAQPVSAFEGQSLALDTDTKAFGRDTVYASIDVLYPLFTGDKISSKIKQAQLNKLIHQTAITRDEQQVVFDIKKYFYGYVFANELHKIANSTLKRMQFVSNITKEFYENGDSLNVKKTDYLNVQVVVSLIKSTVAKIEANRQMVKSALTNAMGVHWNTDLKVNYSNEEIDKRNLVLNDLISKAYETNSDISKLKLAVRVSDAQIDESMAGYYPDVAIKGSVNHTYNSYEYGFLNEEQENMWNIGVVASMNLFNGGRTTYEVKEKKLAKAKMVVLDEMLKEGIALQIKNEFTQANIGYKQIQTLNESKQLAKQNRELNIRGYQIDAIKPEKVIEAQYVEAYVKADYLKYLHDYRLSLAKIDQLVGQEIAK